MKKIIALALAALMPAAGWCMTTAEFNSIKEKYSQELSAFDDAFDKKVKKEKSMKKKDKGPYAVCEDENGKILQEQECLKDESKAYEIKVLKETAAAVARLAPASQKTKYLGEIVWKDAVLQQTFMVNRNWKEMQTFLGFGPEDDRDYDYTNPGYAAAGGSVKINLTGKGFDVIKAYSEYFVPTYGKNSKITKAFLTFVSVLYLHETLHGWQLKTGPVLDVKRYGEEKLKADVAARKLDKRIVDGTTQVVNYEEDAITFVNEHFANNVVMFEILVKEMDKLTQDKDFIQKFPRLDRDFYTYYMQGCLDDANDLNQRRAAGQEIQGFGGLSKYTYAAENVPLETLYEMIAINDKITAGANAAGFADNVAAIKHRYHDLCTPDYGRDPLKDADIIARIKKMDDTYKIMRVVKEAVIKEFEAFDSRL